MRGNLRRVSSHIRIVEREYSPSLSRHRNRPHFYFVERYLLCPIWPRRVYLSSIYKERGLLDLRGFFIIKYQLRTTETRTTL
jgi:hypothetical protein